MALIVAIHALAFNIQPCVLSGQPHRAARATMQEDAASDAILNNPMLGGDPSKPLRPRLIEYFRESPGLSNLGALATFRPELVERFQRVCAPDDKEQAFSGFFGREASPTSPISEEQLKELMSQAGEEELSDEELAEFKVEFSTQGLTFERWVKVMIASTKSAYQKEKAGEAGGGIFSSFGK